MMSLSNKKQRIVVFTGAGVSADSGIATFRDADGLWASHRIEDVCTPEALARDRSRVVEFYNTRRKELLSKEPNAGHRALVELERSGLYSVEIITQNIDDLHQRAGSSHVTHLHGELRKLRSSSNPEATVPIQGWQQELEQRHPDGSLLRPFVVFFGESVPMFERAAQIVQRSDIMIIVGTSLAVYPAASLVHYLPHGAPIYLVDPASPDTQSIPNPITHIKENSAIGLPRLIEKLMQPRQ